MSDIFISYASEDRERAKALAAALQAQDWSVWWDRDHRQGRQDYGW
ncbi:MAG: TIR domain-containing protein [Gammaproteobacteria bacterium]|nr:TIR domain-containing protein [Gammaproteobacteria bacterium]